MEIDLKRLGENIRYLRQGKGWSLADLADKSGVSKAYISDLENGSGGRPNVQYLYKIAVSLGSTIDSLINHRAHSDQKKALKHESPGAALPPGLAEFAQKEKLEPEQIEMLATLNFRGSRPKDADAWRFIYEAIKIASRS